MKRLLLLMAVALYGHALHAQSTVQCQTSQGNYVPCVMTATADPCALLVKNSIPINLTASGTMITGAPGKQTYICSMDIVTATAQNIALVEGTGTLCATRIAGMAGGTTAATGWNFAANSGLVRGDGLAWVYNTDTYGDNVCLLLSSTGQTSGSIQYVQQ